MKRFLHKYGTRPNEIRRAKRELYARLSLLALAVMFLLVMVVVTRFQPRLQDQQIPSAGRQDLKEATDKVELLLSLRQEVDRRYSEFQELSKDPGGAIENMELIEKAIALQNEVIRSRTGAIASREDTERLEELLTVKDSAMGEYLISQSLREEDQAMEAWNQGDKEDAEIRIQRAIMVQEKINEQYPRSNYRDLTRAHRLTNQLMAWQTRPIAEAADELKRQALELIAQQKFAEARKTIRLALKKQEELMENYRKSSFSTLNRMRDFKLSLLEIDAAEDKHNVELLLGLARTRLESGDHPSALGRAEEALLLQESLLQREGMDNQINLARLESIKAIRDTAAGIPAFADIQKAQADTRQAMLKRDMKVFQARLADWYRETRLFQRRFPRSSQLDKTDLDELELLYQLRTEVPVILEMVDGNLVKLPGEPSYYMYKAEVSQALYESVTGSNPSSPRNPQLPANSVTWKEAGEFTKRLATVLACPVLLPSKAHFLSALGNPSLVAIEEQAWSSENSSRELQACGQLNGNTAGFFDLLGNVAEWLDSDSPGQPDGDVVAIGGSARDSSARLAGIPEDWRSPDERNRYIGFRFVVDREQDLN